MASIALLITAAKVARAEPAQPALLANSSSGYFCCYPNPKVTLVKCAPQKGLSHWQAANQ